MIMKKTQRQQANGAAQATRLFHIGDVLSITTGCLLSPRLIGGVYDILNFMTSDNLFTHQLPRAGRECKPYLPEQHPDLASVDTSTVKGDNWKEFLDQQIARFGEQLEIRPIPASAHEIKSPIDEAVEMGAKNVIAIDDSLESVDVLVKEIQK